MQSHRKETATKYKDKVTLPTAYRYSENVHHRSGREKVLLPLRAQWHFQTWKIKDFGPAFINKCLIEGKCAAFFSPRNHYTRLAENHALVHNKPQSVEDLEGEGGGQVLHQAICCRAQRRDMVIGAFLTSHFSCSFLQHEWLPASLPEHLMMLILMTASVFLPVYWWIIIPFGTVSSVKLGTIIQVSTQG